MLRRSFLRLVHLKQYAMKPPSAPCAQHTDRDLDYIVQLSHQTTNIKFLQLNVGAHLHQQLSQKATLPLPKRAT